MVKITENKLRLTAKNKGIKDYQNISKRKLLSTLYKLKHISKILSKNGLNKIVKMQNLSLNEFEQIKRMNNLSLNKLKEIAKIRHIKNYKDMLKEDLLLALLKSNKSHTELLKSESNNAEIEETKKIFNDYRHQFTKEKMKEARKNFSDMVVFDEYLKGLEEKDNLTKKEKRNKERYTEKLQEAKEYIEKLKEDLNKLKKH